MSRPSAGIPRPAWISTGTRRSWASATSSRTAGSDSVNCSARGCSLIPRAPGVQAAARLGHRVVVRVDAAVRDEPAAGAPRPPRCTRSLAGGYPAGSCIGNTTARASRALEHRQQLVRRLTRRRRDRRRRCACGRRRAAGRRSSARSRSHQGRMTASTSSIGGAPYTAPGARWPILGHMHYRRERVRIETQRHEIEGTVQLPERGLPLPHDRLPERPRPRVPRPDRRRGPLDRRRPARRRATTTSRVAVPHIVLVVELETLGMVDEIGAAAAQPRSRRRRRAASARGSDPRLRGEERADRRRASRAAARPAARARSRARRAAPPGACARRAS